MLFWLLVLSLCPVVALWKVFGSFIFGVLKFSNWCRSYFFIWYFGPSSEPFSLEIYAVLSQEHFLFTF